MLFSIAQFYLTPLVVQYTQLISFLYPIWWVWRVCWCDCDLHLPQWLMILSTCCVSSHVLLCVCLGKYLFKRYILLRLGMVILTYHLCNQEHKASGAHIWGHPGLPSKTMSSKKQISKNPAAHTWFVWEGVGAAERCWFFERECVS